MGWHLSNTPYICNMLPLINMINKIKKTFWYGVVSLFTFPLILQAAPPGSPCESGTFCNPIAYDSFMEFVEAILEVVLKIGIPVAAMFIIYSGFLFVKAQGNPEELKKAKSAFTYAVIGTAILLGSWLLATGIESTITSWES